MDRTVTQPGHSEIASSAPTTSVQRPAINNVCASPLFFSRDGLCVHPVPSMLRRCLIALPGPDGRKAHPTV
ncbi:MAG: hypothetical protein M3Y39_18585 [Chloroflexota bacterium]|nr:hypothetical protein [Chloroflexota bacterium]